MLLELMAAIGAAPGRTLMVGDTTHDLLMAQHAGTWAVGVSYGAHPIALLNEAQPLAIFDAFTPLQAWLAPRVGG